jgi:hypothetical protein
MELDNSWINDYELKELNYNDFYKDDIKYIKIYYLLINRKLTLENIYEENFFLESKNKLKKHELISIVNKYKEANKKSNKKIKLLSLLKYNVDIDSDEVINYLKNDTEDTVFLDSLKNLNDVDFKQSISMFEDLNSLFCVFIESNETTTQTKRIVLHNKNKKTKKNKV